jgi:hypothetical protein
MKYPIKSVVKLEVKEVDIHSGVITNLAERSIFEGGGKKGFAEFAREICHNAITTIGKTVRIRIALRMFFIPQPAR